MSKELSDWIASRPLAVQQIAKTYPPGAEVKREDSDKTFYVVGYGELSNDEVWLWVSPTNPYDDYDKAVATKELLCRKHQLEDQ